MSKETHSGQSFDPWSQGNDLIQLIRETINTNSLDSKTGINDNQQFLISTFLQDIKTVLNFGYTDNSQPLTDILITATSLYVYSIQNDVTPLINELVSIFDESNSFYVNNANYQTPSIKWCQVIESFLQTDSIEKITDRLSRCDQYLTEGHFLSSGKILDILKNYLSKTEGGVERLRNAISIIIRGFGAFATSRNFEESFVTVYSLFYKIVQSCPALYASSNKSDQSKSSSDLLEGFVDIISAFIQIGANSNKSYLLDFCFNQILELLPIDLSHPLLVAESFSAVLLGSLDSFQNEQIEKLLPLFKLYAQSGLFTDPSILNLLYSRGFISIIIDCLPFIDFAVISRFSRHLSLDQDNINLLLSIASSITETNTSRVSEVEVSQFVNSIINNVISYGLEDDNKHDFVINAILAILSSSNISNYFVKSLFNESLRLIVEDKDIQHRSALPVEILTQLFSDASIPDESIDFKFVFKQLLESHEERQRESWLKLIDMILSSTNLYISVDDFNSNGVRLSLSDENDLWFIIGHLIEIHGLDAFDKSALGFITDYLESFQSESQNKQTINPSFVQFAFNFIVCQNVQTKKIEMHTMSDKRIKTKTLQKFINPQFVVKMVPLDYDYLLFNIIESEPTENNFHAKGEAEKAIVNLYEKVDTTRISDVIDMFQKHLQNTSFGVTPQQCDNSFAAVLNTLLQFSTVIEKESDIIPGLLGFTRHSHQGEERDYPLQIRIYNAKEDQTFSVDCSLDMKIFELKAIIAAKLNVRAEPLFLYHDNQWLQDSFYVSDYHIANNTCLDLGGKLQPMSQSNYPTIILYQRNFASYLLNSINSKSSQLKRKTVMEFLNYLPTEERTASVVNNGYYFIEMVRNADTIEHLRYIIDTACASCNNDDVIENFSQCNVLSSLYTDMHRNKLGSEGVEVLLHFFSVFNRALPLQMDLKGFIPTLLRVFTIEDGNDELYVLSNSLLNGFLQENPQETTEVSLSNMHLLAEAVRKVPPSSFNDLKSFICGLNDPLSVKLFALAYGQEPRFEEISQELFNVNININIDDSSYGFIEKNLFVLEQLDEEPFKELFNRFTSRLNRDIIDRNKSITENLLKIAQRTKSDNIRKEIFRQVADFSLQSQTAKQSISEFSKEISNVSVYSNLFNISQLDFKQSDIDSKILITDRDDLASVIQILFRTFPFNYYILTEKSFENEAMWKLQYIFKQMVLLYKQSIDATEVTNQFINLLSSNYDINECHDPAQFLQKLSNALPEHIRSVFEGVLHIEIEGDDTDFFTESNENFSLITLPILGFKELKESLVYFFENTDHYVGEKQYYNQDYDELIDAHKTIKFEKLPPVLVLQLERYYNNGVVYNDGINIPSELDVTQLCSQNLLDDEEADDEYNNNFHANKNEKNIYNLTGAIIRDSISHKFRALSKIDGKWFSYESISPSSVKVNNNQSCQILTDEEVIQNSYVVFYTHRNARLPGVVNDIETELELGHPFDLSQYIDEPTQNFLEELNFNFDQQRCAFSAPTMEFMVEHTTPIDYIRYFFNVLCHSIQHDKVSVGANHIIADIIEKIPPNENNHYIHKTMLNSVSMPSTFIDASSSASSNSGLNNNNHRHEINGNQLLDYIQNDFENIVSSLTHSHFHQLISDIIVLILERTGDDQSFNFINKCVDQIKDKKEYDQTSPLSRLILKYILISESNQCRALDTDWAQELIWYLYSVFDFNRSYDFLVKLDFSNLFNVLSILISKDHRPNDLYNLLKIKDQVVVSPRHRHSYIAFLIKLDTADILNSEARDQSFSKAINDFEQSLEDLNKQSTIPDEVNLPDFFTELRRQIETGDENLRTNILNSFNSQLVPYLGYPDPEVRNSAKLLYYSAHENSSREKNDLSIIQLLVNIGSAQECSTIIEVVNTLMKRNNLYEDKYIDFLFSASSSMKSSLCSSTSLILSVISQYDINAIEGSLQKIVDSVSGDYDELIDFILQRFTPESIAKTLDYHGWNEIVARIDKNHHISLIQKLLPLLSQEEENTTRGFVASSILRDNSLTLMNSFLSSTIKLFESPQNFAKLLKLVDYAIRRGNETVSNTEECQYYQRSIVNISDIIVQNLTPGGIREGTQQEIMSRSSSSSFLQSNTNNNNNNNGSQNNSPSSSLQINPASHLINTNDVIYFFNNFWGQLCSDKLLDLILFICSYDSKFEDEMIKALEGRMDIRVEPFEKDKWFLAIICSQIVLNQDKDADETSKELKSIYDRSVKQHSRKEKSRPDEIFDFYMKQTSNHSRQQQDERWIINLAQRLLPEAHFLSDEERKFYERIFSNYHDVSQDSEELESVIGSIIHPPTESLTPVGGLDLQRSALLARQREAAQESINVKKEITENYGMTREEAMRLARQDWYLEKFVSYLYGEVESAPEAQEFIDEDEEEIISTQGIEEEPEYAKERGIIDFQREQEENLLEKRREQERLEELRRQQAQIEAQQKQQQYEREEQERAQREQEQREREERERAQREQEDRERAQREQEQREREERERAQREQEQREREEQERAQREQEQREREEREKAQREQEERERAQREQEQREREDREREEREKAQREQEERERAQREQEERERAQREQEEREKAQREQEEREREDRERAQREQDQREQEEREQARREQEQKEQEEREKAQREQEDRERAQREQEEREKEEQREREEREKAEREAESHKEPELIDIPVGQKVSDRGFNLELPPQEEIQVLSDEQPHTKDEQEQANQEEEPKTAEESGIAAQSISPAVEEEQKQQQQEEEPKTAEESGIAAQSISLAAEEEPGKAAHQGPEPIEIPVGQNVSDRGFNLELPPQEEIKVLSEEQPHTKDEQEEPKTAEESGIAAQSISLAAEEEPGKAAHQGPEPIEIPVGQNVSDRGFNLELPPKEEIQVLSDEKQPEIEKPEPKAAEESGIAASPAAEEEQKKHSAQEVGSAAVVAASYLIMQFLKERQNKQ